MFSTRFSGFERNLLLTIGGMTGPNCSDKGHENLWKRMCRLEGCSEPARDGSVEPRSKYCSDEHGAEFMRQRVFGPGSETLDTGPPSNKKRRKANYTDNLGNTEEGLSDSDDRAHLRGGVLKASELKAVTDGVKDLQSFHKLGDGILSPPPTVSPEGDVKMEDGGEFYPDKISYTPEEMAQLESITAKKEQTRAKKRLLDDRDRLLVLIAARAKTVLAELKENDKSVKDICGYDNRLTWSDEEFNHWRVTPEGQEALAQVKEGDLDTGDQTMSGTSAKVNGSSDKEDDEMGKGVCKRKRCARHQAWLKLQKQDNLFERDQARQEMRKLDAEERGVRDRAKIRSLEAGDANAKG